MNAKTLLREHLPIDHGRTVPLEGVMVKEYTSGKQAKNDFALGKYLKQKGVSVPSTIAIVRPDFPFLKPSRPLSSWYVLFQNVPGAHIPDLEGDELEIAVQQYRQGLEQILGLGILPHDSTYIKNVLFEPKDSKVYFLDWEKWERKPMRYEIEFFSEIARNVTAESFKFAHNNRDHIAGVMSSDYGIRLTAWMPERYKEQVK